MTKTILRNFNLSVTATNYIKLQLFKKASLEKYYVFYFFVMLNLLHFIKRGNLRRKNFRTITIFFSKFSNKIYGFKI